MNQPDDSKKLNKPHQPQQSPNISWLSIVQSVCAAFFGVQSDAKRKRDFESGAFWHFVVAGVIFTLIFILIIWGAVRFLLATSGG